MGTTNLSVHALRGRWKPKKEALLAIQDSHPTCIRLHRAFSWIARCENETDLDTSLICLWIAFNSLYAQWDEDRREPQRDIQSLRTFIDRIIGLDESNHLSSMLQEQHDKVMNIFDDEYLSAYFWVEPSRVRASKSKKSKFDARTWYIDGKWRLLTERLVERIYLLRCQIIHGAATHGGKLNRDSLKKCAQMLRDLLNCFLLVITDHGHQQDWGMMCNPPLNSPQSMT
ncbi:MAG: hypothetical protein IT447_00130 [Phycisphaerales bacterium]|jgi:hypothetical protein|nr:hypothetical protein [Phycisphaerales bacterium]